ncbi:unnamed protein product [Colletotrichum noveboracense]|uniref:Zn(2)-C6 fungal-type domain-containing protein n=1 Tax=Colletotrichum noveboracense TaxID=2664923 RepID=A0A9W4W378_9PEZI|nr:hypothetical protein K456DRAFT_1112035 [Colletotrichum gloeosporioides 23]CAI0641353.1 unnamed protein product [Colletotrichum noveboracense]
MATPSTKDNLAPQPEFGKILFNKPCSTCRRRKVKCDRQLPCGTCGKNGTAATCTYDVPREGTPESQQRLQERVARLEREIEELKGMAARGEPLRPPKIPLLSTTPSSFSEYNSIEESMAGDPGIQVDDENVSFYLGPNYWLNIQEYNYEPRHLYRIESDKTGKNPDSPTAWPIGRNPALPDMSHFHLDPEKEDILTDLFFAHVEPFIRMSHNAYWRQQITDFRVGVSKIPVDVEAAMFTTQALTVAALPAVVIQEKLGKAKKDVLRHLQEASQLALERADILRSRKLLAFIALLYHIQMKFITGDGEIAVSLLGLAGRFGTRIGLHRDPGHYPTYTPWVTNMRRRIWGHFELLDNPVYNLEGADSGLPFISDTQPATNANDSQWVPTRFAKPSSAPSDQEGITDMSFVLVRQCLMKTMQSIARRRNGSSPEELGRIVEQTENFLTTKFMSHVVAANPSHAIMLSYYKGSMKSMRLLIHQLHAQRTFGPEPDYRAKYYQECVEILEEMERGENIALQNHWGWLYRWPTTPCLIYNVLIGLRDQSNHPITDRAWRQINVVFRRHNNEDISMRKFAAWRVIEELCEEAIHYHKQRSHQGAWYTHRLDTLGPISTAKGKETLSLENATVDDILGDVRMFGQPSASHTAVMGGPGYFAAQPVLQPMSFTSWGQPPQATVPSQYPTNEDSDDEEEDDDDDEEM